MDTRPMPGSTMLALTLKSSLGFLALMLLAGTAYAHGMSEADKQLIAEGGNLRYLWIGATHMLTGYDHLAFVFGIIFFLSSFRDIVKYVTAFTVGHSITLIWATFQGIQLNYFIVDAIIGLSVCYIAFANLDGFRKYLNINPPNMMAMIVGLGLIHGLGLSTRLQELPLDPEHLLANIVSFNIGIELGQVAALAIMLSLVAIWRHRHSFKAFSLITNYGLIAVGLFLFLMQMHDYSHSRETGTAIAAEVPRGAAVTGNEKPRSDEITVTVPARGDIEYKVLMKRDATLNYAWKTGGTELTYDFHGDPKGDTSGYFKSYAKGSAAGDSGEFSPPFEGRHGWYWKNSTNAPVTVQLHLEGVYALMKKPLHATTDPLAGMEPDSAFMDLAPAPAE